jgi:hypothetical protein
MKLLVVKESLARLDEVADKPSNDQLILWHDCNEINGDPFAVQSHSGSNMILD